ncbi:hypothetical protein Tco_0177858 [Tanacetum coccineum]
MKIPDWVISDEIEAHRDYRNVCEVFGIDLSLAEHKSQEEQEARENVELVNKHLASEEIEKMVDEPKNVIDDSPIPRKMIKIFPTLGRRRKYIDEVYKLTRRGKRKDYYRRELWIFVLNHSEAKFLSGSHMLLFAVSSPGRLLLERQQNKEETDKMIAKPWLQEHGRLQAKISSQIQQAIDNHIPSLVDEFVRNYMSGHILYVHPAQPQTTSVPEQQY